MIIAEATRTASGLDLVLVYPRGGRKPAFVKNEKDGERLVYFRNREYIIDKLQKWVRQRSKAAEKGKDNAMQFECASLLVLLRTHENAFLNVACVVINNHLEHFLKLVPKEKSAHHIHYEKTIKPILHFCYRKAKESIQQ